MAWWSWFTDLFKSAEAPKLLVRDGHKLRWPSSLLPIDIYVDPSALQWWEDLWKATNIINASLGRRVFYQPVEAIHDMTSLFMNSDRRKSKIGGLYVTCDKTIPATHADTSFSFNTQTGEIRNVLTRLPVMQPPWSYMMIVHEIIGHALGLDHVGDSQDVMSKVLTPRSRSWFTADELALLKQTYPAGQ